MSFIDHTNFDEKLKEYGYSFGRIELDLDEEQKKIIEDGLYGKTHSRRSLKQIKTTHRIKHKNKKGFGTRGIDQVTDIKIATKNFGLDSTKKVVDEQPQFLL